MPAVIAHTFEYSPASGGRAAEAPPADRQEVTPHMAGHRRRSGDPLRVLKRLENRLVYWANAIAEADDPIRRMNLSVMRLASVLRLVDAERAGELAGLIQQRADAATADASSDVRANLSRKEPVR